MRQMGSRLIYWTSCNLQGCILNSRRVFKRPRSKPCRLQSRCGASLEPRTRKLETAASPGYLRRCPPRICRLLSVRTSGSHAIRSAGWHLELPVGCQGRDEDFKASGRPPTALWAAREDPARGPTAGLQSELGGEYTTHDLMVTLW